MNIPEARLESRYRRLDHVEPDPRRPRRHSRKQIQQLAGSSETCRFAVPMLPGSAERCQQPFDGFARHAGSPRSLAEIAGATEVVDAA